MPGSSDQNISGTVEGRRVLMTEVRAWMWSWSVRSRASLADRLGPHGGHTATETNHRQSRQPTSEVQEIRDIQRQ